MLEAEVSACAGSLKTEEKTKKPFLASSRSELYWMTTSTTSRQCTNWEWRRRPGRLPDIDDALLLRKEVIQPHLQIGRAHV